MTTLTEKMLARAAELEADAAALRTAARVLDADAQVRKVGTHDRTLRQAMKVRAAQRNGHASGHASGNGTGHAPAAPAAATPTKRGRPVGSATRETWAQLRARRDAKRDQVVALVRAYGKPMPLAALGEAAAAKGIDNLTGIAGYVKQGLLKRSGHGKRTRYTFVTT